MYEYFSGTLIEKNAQYTVIDIGGIGYKIYIPVNLLGKLPQIQEKVFLYVSWIVREMSQTLYGFGAQQERDLFELLLDLPGIGPKSALSLVGHFEWTDLERIVHEGNSSALTRVPGIGKKTAERLIVDLKSKLKLPLLPKKNLVSSKIQDALNALIHLGYSQTNAEQAVNKAVNELAADSDLSTLITAALKYR